MTECNICKSELTKEEENKVYLDEWDNPYPHMFIFTGLSGYTEYKNVCNTCQVKISTFVENLKNVE